MASQVFRAGVVVVVRHPQDGTVLAFERVDAPGSWQLPQGGMQPDEEPIEAAWRELMEETGLGEQQVIARAELEDWIAYEWPAAVIASDGHDGRRRGQVQRWFLFDALDPGIEPTPDGTEFVAWRWVPAAWLIEHVIEWRRPAYVRGLANL